MTKIKFGTDGWRAIIAKEYTCDNVARVSIAVGDWLSENKENPSVVIGHDCRFGGEIFAGGILEGGFLQVDFAGGIFWRWDFWRWDFGRWDFLQVGFL